MKKMLKLAIFIGFLATLFLITHSAFAFTGTQLPGSIGTHCDPLCIVSPEFDQATQPGDVIYVANNPPDRSWGGFQVRSNLSDFSWDWSWAHDPDGQGNFMVINAGDGSTIEQFLDPKYYILFHVTHGVIDSVGVPVIQPPTHNPVLIVPGVLGTEILNSGQKLWLDLGRNFTDIGDQFMDPMQFDNNLLPLNMGLSLGNVLSKETVNLGFGRVVVSDYTDGLIKEFQNQGYVLNTDLFLFPYDWRYGVNDNLVNQLKQKILDIKTKTGVSKVDIIAHSNGGLVVKKYVADNLTNNYINKAIFVGVPNTGAPKAIKVLIQGDGFGIPWLADGEMKKIASNLPAVYDLAPSQQYFDQKGSYVKIINQGAINNIQDLNFNQANNFLTGDHQLNSQGVAEANNLHTANFDNFDLSTAGVDLYSINGCRTGTIGKIIERRNTSVVPYNASYDQPEEVSGDGTVPLASSTNLPIDVTHKFFALQGDHGKMLSYNGIRQEIVNIISGSNLNVDSNLITQTPSECDLVGDLISVYSPLDIDVTDQNGNHSGLSSGGIENNIPNADFEIMGEHKFVYIPTDSGQTYTISLKGTGSGTFTLTDTHIVNNQAGEVEIYKDIPVTTSLKGNLDIKNTTKLTLDTNGDNTVDFNLVGIPNSVVKMPYIFSGFLQPINDTGHQKDQTASVFKAGSTVPVKFQLKKLDGTITQATTTPIWLTPLQGSKMSAAVDESVYSDAATSGNTFKWDGSQYIYNWSTKGLIPGYWYKISVKLDDGNTYSVTVGLK
ncbi:MAG: PxKF domain-containing protein [Patescibacteria group bacterium]